MVKQTINITLDLNGSEEGVRRAIASAQKSLFRLLDVALPGIAIGKTALPVSLYAGEKVDAGDYSVTLTLSEGDSKGSESGT